MKQPIRLALLFAMVALLTCCGNRDDKTNDVKSDVAWRHYNEARQAKNLELTIEPRLLSAFKRIRRNSRNGLGVVYVQRDACGGCFNKIPPQRQLDIRMRKKIIVCEYCGRIMVDPELAGVEMVEKEEKPKRRRATRKKADEKAED